MATLPARITLRERLRGGGVRTQAAFERGFGMQAGGAIFLIHGFNVNQKDADQSYEAFRSRLNEKIENRYFGEFYDIYWPGDFYEGWAGPLNGLLSIGAYPLAVTKAIEAAPVLGEFILENFGPSVGLHFICHSLGNRLLLETVHYLSKHGRRAASATMMAAAVLTDMVGESGRFEATRDDCGKTLVLHSAWDTVLRGAFPIGDGLENTGTWGEAIGLYGNPAQVWKGGPRHQMPRYKHGQYWAGHESSEKVANHFGFATLNRIPTHNIVQHELPVNEV